MIIKFLKSVLLSCLLLVLLAVGSFYYFIYGVHLRPVALGNLQNAVWLEHDWVDNNAYLEQVPALVGNLKKHGMRYAYIHVGPLEDNGTIDPVVYRNAAEFLRRARALDDEIVYYAWIGQLRSKIDLDDPAIYAKILRTTTDLTSRVGFGGIHIDIEPIRDDDESFLSMVEFLSKQLPETVPISVAVNKFVPLYVPDLLHIVEFNTRPYYERLDQLVDQIVVMTYDTGIQSPRIYSWFVEQQLLYLSRVVKSADLLIGIPSYSYEDEELAFFPNFHPEAENVTSGMQGVQRGLANIRTSSEQVHGIALYAYWETAEQEWEVFEKMRQEK